LLTRTIIESSEKNARDKYTNCANPFFLLAQVADPSNYRTVISFLEKARKRLDRKNLKRGNKKTPWVLSQGE